MRKPEESFLYFDGLDAPPSGKRAAQHRIRHSVLAVHFSRTK
ncbi:hypothetical protein BGLA2_2750005 [Burkholderia gladioli]|nr:hypothetical protein BGLA2_2750005 [Burkholderia gladioli]